MKGIKEGGGDGGGDRGQSFPDAVEILWLNFGEKKALFHSRTSILSSVLALVCVCVFAPACFCVFYCLVCVRPE